MNKKILLSGIAALLIGGSMHATSVSASAISVEWAGEATLSATFSDTCAVAATDLTADATSNATGAFADFLGLTYAPDDDNTDPDQIEDALNALNGFTNTLPADLSMTGTITFVPNPCGTTNPAADNPVWKTSSEYKWSAGGTLANGLGISVGDAAADGVAITLSGAFGSVSFEQGGDSAVKVANVGGDGDIDVAGSGFGGHALSTSGTAGYVVNYQAPSVGGMDLYISYAPSSENAATNTDKYLDTLAFGATMAAGDITIGAGYETASANANACAAQTLTATGTPLAQSIAAFQGQNCGDQTLMGIGASMSVADLGLNVGYTALDTEGGDTTTYNIGLSTSMGAYSLALDYVNSTLDYASTHADAVDSTQTVLAAGVSTNLGDGVDLGLSFSNNSVNVLDQGAHSNYRAEAKLTITY